MLPLSLKEVILKKLKEREKEKQLCFNENMSSSTSSYKTILPNIVTTLEWVRLGKLKLPKLGLEYINRGGKEKSQSILQTS